MPDPRAARQYRFGIFEADPSTGELRRNGLRVKLHSQPFQLLCLLADRPGQILTREEICRELWPDGTFVDYEHGVNSAVNRLREALGDKASNPRFVETVARRGYRFVAPVEQIGVDAAPMPAAEPVAESVAKEVAGKRRVLAAPEDLPKSPPRVVQALFALLQVMYLAFYGSALANLPEINDMLMAMPYGEPAFRGLVATAVLLIPVRAFLLCGVLFGAPGMQGKFRKMWPLLLPLDALWALAPFLLLHHISYGLALACTALLVYSPFAQRSLMLMGAGLPTS